MLKIYFHCVLFVCIPFLSTAQSGTEEQKVMEPVNNLFKGMALGDSSLVHSAFGKNITMATILRDKSNAPVIHHESSLDGFLKAVGTPHEKAWNEPIWNVKIQIDGDFAQVWCDYAFYIGDQFNHCGVDAFHLFRSNDGWKIFHLADTRRKTECDIPEEIQRKYKKP